MNPYGSDCAMAKASGAPGDLQKRGIHPDVPQETRLTLFAVPKAFRGHTDIIQRNAITSWTRLNPRPDIILLGNDEGTREVALELGVRHMPDITTNQFKTPLVNSIFELAERNSGTPWLAYLNADCILADDFSQALILLGREISRLGTDKFFLSSQRIELDIKNPIDFDGINWAHDLDELVREKGVLDYKAAVEMFFFSRGLFTDIPPFAVGRTVWDNWLVWAAENAGATMIDASPAFRIIHQCHDWSHMQDGWKQAWKGAETKENIALSNGRHKGIDHVSTHFLDKNGLRAGIVEDRTDGRQLVKRRIVRGLEELSAGQYQEALDFFADAIMRGGGSAENINYHRALCFLGLNDDREAAEALTAELSAAPGNMKAKILLSKLHYSSEIKGHGNPGPASVASENCQIIPPEIKDDEFYHLIIELAGTQKVSTILEIGSSAGGGSTEAFVVAMEKNPAKPSLYCMEVSQPRFKELKRRYADKEFVRCYNTSSVSRGKFASPAEVAAFYHSIPTNLNAYPLPQVLGWLEQDIAHLQSSGLDEDGIAAIARENGISHFDMVLIDGSEFTGKSELDEVYGARWILLDDINAFKNFANYQRLRNDPSYEIYRENWHLRNGYAVFKKKEAELPIHFFTIVLNGMPFLRYHIDIFSRLSCNWHWHIVEGVADLVHDTAWSKPSGGHLPDNYHRNGLSVDGTTDYLDTLQRQFPDQISIYRKPGGHFWEGKLEMVNAPISSIAEECLLWQVDVDEFWTKEQVVSVSSMFAENPEKSAAFYWCHFFVGKELVINSRNCYSQNPGMEWLRTWRYSPGCRWVAHEPPRLHRPLPEGTSVDVAVINPFSHGETEANGLVFQHMAYVLPQQLRFKESYYGYQGALAGWTGLQEQVNFPVLLRDHFPWVRDHTTVVPASLIGVVPLKVHEEPRKMPVTVIDGVFFQMNHTGIARVWKAILSEWARTEFGKSIVVLDRIGTAPRIPGLRYRIIPAYDVTPKEWDRNMLQVVCNEEGADLFISSYYTTPLTTPSLFLAHDMIPECTNYYDLSHPQWQEKHHAISRASAFVAVSRNTAFDLGRLYPGVAADVVVAHNGLDSEFFSPASDEEIRLLRESRSLDKPFFLFVGSRNGYKNGQFLAQAFSCLPDKENCTLLYVGGLPVLEPGIQPCAAGCDVRVANLSDQELRVAYSCAVALVYPSRYEGFGLPILEAMGCGCPVITCQNSSLPEVAGAAALYVEPDDPQQLATAMQQVQLPEVRQQLIRMGTRQSGKFSWGKMAGIIQEVVCNRFNAAGAYGVPGI